MYVHVHLIPYSAIHLNIVVISTALTLDAILTNTEKKAWHFEGVLRCRVGNIGVQNTSLQMHVSAGSRQVTGHAVHRPLQKSWHWP